MDALPIPRLANHGRELTPRVIDFVQDRHGKVIWPKNWRPCDGCNKADWDGRPMPRFQPSGRQLMDPMTAYQLVHIADGVVTRCPAHPLRDIHRPLFGPTGTTTGPPNAWFMRGPPALLVGVSLVSDQTRSIGGYVTGVYIAAPTCRRAQE